MGEVKDIVHATEDDRTRGGKLRAMAEEKDIQRRDASSSLPIRYGDESAGETLGDIRIENEVVGTIASVAAADGLARMMRPPASVRKKMSMNCSMTLR